MTLDKDEIERLKGLVKFSNIADPQNVPALRHLSRTQREEFALHTGSMVLYFGPEVADCRRAEEAAALAAQPKGYGIEQLNGLNIGCGSRLISPYLTPIDIMRSAPDRGLGGEHTEFTPNAILALPDALPFRHNSIDFIVALHMLEHAADPIEVVRHWLDILKPGGGLGIVLPDWRYTWDARRDGGAYGHKWNSTPELVRRLFEEHWSCDSSLEAIDTYDFKLSFDFVLRKHGDFVCFSRQRLEDAPSGRQLALDGIFLG